MKRYLTKFSHVFETMKVPTEFPRKTRIPLDNLKASEFRTIALAGFVLFSNVFDGPRDRVIRMRRFWLLQVCIMSLHFLNEFKAEL